MTSPRPAAWSWCVCVALGLATFLNYMDRQALAVTLPTLDQLYQLGASRIGWLEGSFGYAFAVGCLVFGLLVDRYGPRLLYPMVLAGWSLAGVASSMASDPRLTQLLEFTDDRPGTGAYRWLISCRLILGFFEAGHWPCALLTVRTILLEKNRPLGNGLLQSGASLGAIIMPIYLLFITRQGYSWSVVFSSVGLLGLAWIPLWFLLMRRSDFTVQPTYQHDNHSAKLSLMDLVPQVLVLLVIVCCINISWQFLRTWLPLYLTTTFGYSPESTAYCTSAYFIATDIGCLAAGFFVTALVGRGFSLAQARLLGFALFTLLTAFAVLVPFTNGGILTILCLMLAGAGILGLHPYYYALVQDLPARWMATFSGSLAACGWVVASTFQILIGAEIEQRKSYTLGLILVGALPILGLATLTLLTWRRSNQLTS